MFHYLRLPVAFAVLSLSFVLVGCTGEPGDGWPGTVDTTATGVVEVSNPPQGRWSPEETWRVEEVSRVGSVEGEGPDLFGRIGFVSVDPMGRSWAFDSQAGEIRVFTPEGEWVRTVGRAGEGPGEFANPSGMAWDPEGRAWIMDPRAVRVSLFDSAGIFLTSHRMSGGVQRYPWGGLVDAEGRLWDQVGAFDETWVVRFSPDLVEADSFPVPADPRAEERSVTFTTEVARMTVGIPFAGNHIWRIAGDGRVWTLLTESYRFTELSPEGDTLRRARVPYEILPVSAAERVEAAERWSGSMGDLDPSLIPDEKPPVGSFVVDDTGHLWVGRTPVEEHASAGTAEFDVLNPEGIYLGRVALPWPVSTSGLWIRGEDMVGVTRDELGVQYLVRGRVVRGG
jgi:hypothetical protein